MSPRLADYVAPETTLSVDGSGRFANDGAATAGGSVSCTAGAFGSSFVTAAQSVGRVGTVNGGTYVQLPCEGDARPWSVTLAPGSGLFRGGKATVTVNTYVCDGIACAYDQTTRTVTLSGK